MVHFGPEFGLPEPAGQGRAGLIILGLWWGLFSLPAIFVLRDRDQAAAERQPLHRAARQALSEVGRTLRNMRLYPLVATFLVAYLFYNELGAAGYAIDPAPIGL